MTLATDPFLKCYDAVFNLLFGGTNNPFATMVKVGNRVSFGTPIEFERSPAKQSLAFGTDLPEVQLIDEGGALNLHANSSSLGYTQNLTLYIMTGDFRYGNFCSKLNWYTAVNFANWRSTLGGLSWNGHAGYIKNIKAGAAIQIGESNPIRNRGIDGWTSVWRLQIDMMIQNTDLVFTEG